MQGIKKTKDFIALNRYQRKSQLQWEKEYNREQNGQTYFEDERTLLRYPDYNEFLVMFHYLHYFCHKWTRKDVYNTFTRFGLSSTGDIEYQIDKIMNNPIGYQSFKRKKKTFYSSGDYMPKVMAWKSRWVDALHELIDKQRAGPNYTYKEFPESDIPGVIYLPKGNSRFGFTATDHGTWIATKYLPDKIIRQMFTSKTEAEEYKLIQDNKYKNVAY